MKYLFTLFLCLSYLGIKAQHNLYNWQLKGYTGVAHYYNPAKNSTDYLELNHNLWHQLEMSRNLGNTFGLSASAAFGKISGLGLQGSSFTTNARMTALRLYFYTDNGWLLKPTSFVSPFFFGGYGLSTFTIDANNASDNSKYKQIVPFGAGLKFRLNERWQLDLQTEAVYNTKPRANPSGIEQNKHNNSFLHTGLALAYNLGFKKSDFKAARFYVNFRDTLSQASSAKPVSGRLAKPAMLPDPSSSPTNRLVRPKLSSKQDSILVAKHYKSRRIDSLRYKGITIPHPDTISNGNRSRVIARKSPISPDTTVAGEKAKNDRKTVEKELNPRLKQVTPLTREEKIRVSDEPRTTDVPNAVPDSSTGTSMPASNVHENVRLNQNTMVLPEKDTSKKEETSGENQRLLYARDSLNTAMVKDTTLMKRSNQQDSVFNNLDDKTRQYMQQQAAFNDSIRQQLAFYDKLMRLPPAPAITPGSKPTVRSSYNTNVFFKVNSYEVPSESFNELLAIAAQLQANPSQKLLLTGYADQAGKTQYNLVLSRKRVEGVAAFFQRQGIAKERILVQYFGEDTPGKALYSLNRKVVLKTID